MAQANFDTPEEPEVPHPLLSHVIERNIRTITRLRLQTAHERTVQERLADAITSFSGSMLFVYLHILWFGAWLLVNTGRVGIPPFDPFPYGLLTMIVSLEAIFLSTFVMVSQNRQAARADIRSELDFETNLRSEIWSVHIGQALGVDPAHVEDVVRKAIEGSKAQLAGS